MFERITESAFDSQQFNVKHTQYRLGCMIAGAGQRKSAWSQTAQRCRLSHSMTEAASPFERQRELRCGQLVHRDVTVDRGKRQMR